MPALRSVLILALVKLAIKHLSLTMPFSTLIQRTKHLANYFARPCLVYLAWEMKKSLVFMSSTVHIRYYVVRSSFV